MDRVGVLDLGTNTFRLLIISRTEHRRLRRELIERRVVRIGEGFVRKGKISGTPLKRSLKVLKEFSTLLRRHKVDCVAAVATGVFREAENASQVLSTLSASSPAPIRKISGLEEGTYTLQGVRAGLDLQSDRTCLIMDIGGGSTEFIRIDAQGEVRIESLPLGVVYLKERYSLSASSDLEGYPDMEQGIDHALENAASLFEEPDSPICIGTGGTITTLSYMDFGLKRYASDKIHGAVLTLEKVEGLLKGVIGASTGEIRRRFHLEQGRADLVLYGGALLQGILKKLPGRSLLVSDYGLLEGLAVEMLDSAPPAQVMPGTT